jgi:hypothetical protein
VGLVFFQGEWYNVYALRGFSFVINPLTRSIEDDQDAEASQLQGLSRHG